MWQLYLSYSSDSSYSSCKGKRDSMKLQFTLQSFLVMRYSTYDAESGNLPISEESARLI